MTIHDTTARRWSIGELARASGVTVRTLHHYDEIGLLTPSGRTSTGHRRYDEADLRRLYRIRALRSLGLSLPDIAATLDDSTDSLAAIRDLLTGQLRVLGSQSERLRQLQQQIHDLLLRLDQSAMPEPDQFMATLEMISMLDAHFTPEQRDQLAHRRTELGDEAIAAAKIRWADLVERLLNHARDDTPVTDPAVQDLVRQWDELGDAFHAGDDTKDAARRMWQDNSTEISQRLPWPAEQLTGLVDYLDRARRSR